MLQIRKKNGDVVPIDSSVAVEFVDTTGKLAVVITQSPGGSVNIVTPGDPVFNAYLHISGLRQSRVAVHEPFKTKSK